jgi:hypothetical protein
LTISAWMNWCKLVWIQWALEQVQWFTLFCTILGHPFTNLFSYTFGESNPFVKFSYFIFGSMDTYQLILEFIICLLNVFADLNKYWRATHSRICKDVVFYETLVHFCNFLLHSIDMLSLFLLVFILRVSIQKNLIFFVVPVSLNPQETILLW